MRFSRQREEGLREDRNQEDTSAKSGACCFCGAPQLCLTLWASRDCGIPGCRVFTLSLSWLKLVSIESVMPANHLILLPWVFPSIRVFSNELTLYIRWPKYWSFRFSICFFNEYSAVISFWTDWFDLLAVHRALKNFLQHPNSKPSVLQCSAFFMSSSHIHAWLLKKPLFDYMGLCLQSDVSAF